MSNAIKALVGTLLAATLSLPVCAAGTPAKDNFSSTKEDWIRNLAPIQYKGPDPCWNTKGLCPEDDVPPSTNAIVHFSHDSSQILPQYNEPLNNLGETLSGATPLADAVLVVQGHTDSTGSESYNNRLAVKRANAVVQYLRQRYGISAVRLQAEGKGESSPIADNSTEAGRKLNRRVVFIRKGRYME